MFLKDVLNVHIQNGTKNTIFCSENYIFILKMFVNLLGIDTQVENKKLGI